MKKLLRHLTDARILILVFFLIRLYGITNPPLERNHNWRQATTNMYARNFLEVDNNILYSRVDMAGDLTGITAKEFPLFNYLIYLTAEIFGWQHWYGRLISLIVSSFGAWFFYLLIKKYIDEPRPPSAVHRKPSTVHRPARHTHPPHLHLVRPFKDHHARYVQRVAGADGVVVWVEIFVRRRPTPAPDP